MSNVPLLSGLGPSGPFANALDATLEIGAYETLWNAPRASFKTLAERFAEKSGTRPSDFVPEDEARAMGRKVVGRLRESLKAWFNVRLRGEIEYPQKLRDAKHPVELLYYQGDWGLVSSRSVAVVGTRKPSDDGAKRARQLVKNLLQDDFTIVSGLADGIDKIAHEAALKEGGRTYAVIGTPLDQYYPKLNSDLQKKLAEEYLVVSQIPVERYSVQNPTSNRFFFPERNKTMSALTEATIIVEAGETSGTLTQARAAIDQGRKLFILNSCFENPALTWPAKFEAKGAIRVREYADIQRELVTDGAEGH